MKIKITEIEATAEELKQSNSLADGFRNLIRNAFFNPYVETDEQIEDEQSGKE